MLDHDVVLNSSPRIPSFPSRSDRATSAHLQNMLAGLCDHYEFRYAPHLLRDSQAPHTHTTMRETLWLSGSNSPVGGIRSARLTGYSRTRAGSLKWVGVSQML